MKPTLHTDDERVWYEASALVLKEASPRIAEQTTPSLSHSTVVRYVQAIGVDIDTNAKSETLQEL